MAMQVMASTGFRRLDVGRVAGVERESDFIDCRFYSVLHRVVLSDRLAAGDFGCVCCRCFPSRWPPTKGIWLAGGTSG